MIVDFPVHLSLFGKEIWVHPILETIGVFIGMRYYFYLKRKNSGNLTGNKSLAVLLGAMIGAFLGSKLIGNLENPSLLFQAENPILFIWSNNTIIGGLAFFLAISTHGISVDEVKPKVNQLLCCLPEVSAPNLDYDNLFRIIIMNFMDAYDFDVRAVKKSCVHIVNKDLKLIPFETMNLFYRDEKSKYLEKLRKENEILF